MKNFVATLICSILLSSCAGVSLGKYGGGTTGTGLGYGGGTVGTGLGLSDRPEPPTAAGVSAAYFDFRGRTLRAGGASFGRLKVVVETAREQSEVESDENGVFVLAVSAGPNEAIRFSFYRKGLLLGTAEVAPKTAVAAASADFILSGGRATVRNLKFVPRN